MAATRHLVPTGGTFPHALACALSVALASALTPLLLFRAPLRLRAQVAAPSEYHNVLPNGKPRSALISADALGEGPKTKLFKGGANLIAAVPEGEDQPPSDPFVPGSTAGAPMTPVGGAHGGAGTPRGFGAGVEEEHGARGARGPCRGGVAFQLECELPLMSQSVLIFSTTRPSATRAGAGDDLGDFGRAHDLAEATPG